MAPKVLLVAIFSYIAIYGVTAKSTLTGFEEKLEEILQELVKNEKRTEAGNEIAAEKVKSDKKASPGKRVFDGISGIDDITPQLLQLAMDEAFRHSREIVEEDEALKMFYFYRGGNIVSFDTTNNIILLSENEYDLLGREYIILEVRACSDALVELHHSNGETYQIHIGVGDNSSLSIHTAIGEVASITHTFAVLDCNHYRRFLISWAANHIDVLQEDENVDGVGWNVLIEWTDDSSDQLSINDIGFGTSGNVEGHWRTDQNKPYQQ
ncbi:uncharacterized protein LOC117341743 [Pecten maximus]|uniref:uncharacterized protein LOC117341743 n=1 Tax=Pecten maximus TaxID=6579 RepID=UPI00145879D1|nr:uncharacterized protein LOC117341743 [Pecten maximus]